VGWPELLLSPCLSVRASGWRKDLAHNVAEPITSLEARLIGRAALRLKHHPHLPDDVEQRAGQS